MHGTFARMPPARASAPFAHLRRCLRTALGAIIGVSFLVNLLMLSGPIFMLQVYDRVLPSRSLSTLTALGLIVVLFTLAQGILDLLRSRILTRVGHLLSEDVSPQVFDRVIDGNRRADGAPAGLQIAYDFETVRAFVASPAVLAFFDLPWCVLYVGVCFLFHAYMGWAVLGSVIVLCGLMLATEALLARSAEAAAQASNARRSFSETIRRNAGIIHALSMRRMMAAQWEDQNATALHLHQVNADRAATLSSLLKTLRMLMQSALLALGAYLVINQEATAGVMLAATILTVRALAPIEMLVANWSFFIKARASWTRLRDALTDGTDADARTALPAPKASLRLTALSLAPNGSDTPVLHDVSFELKAGTALAVVGPSGSGKSSLAKAIVGLWQPARGTIRLDNAQRDHWPSDTLGRHIGYLPQDVEIMPGTVAQNIARFAADDPAAILRAAQQAGVHDMILALPEGYDTRVGEGGAQLSGGQRQRLALARALYGDPFLVVLDEPNSNLDSVGEAALAQAIQCVKARAGIAIVIAHRPSILASVDQVLVVNAGRMRAFGPRDAILAELTGANAAHAKAEVAKTDLAKPDLSRPDLSRPDLSKPDLRKAPPVSASQKDSGHVTAL